MAKKKVNKKSNKTLNMLNNPYYNMYGIGGAFLGIKNKLKAGISDEDLGNSIMNLAGNVGDIAGLAIGNGYLSGAGNAISGIGGAIGDAIPGPYGKLVKLGSGVLGGITNRLTGSKLNQENINKIDSANKAMMSVQVDDSSNDSIMSSWDKLTLGSNFSKSDIGSDGIFGHKARDKYKLLLREQAFGINNVNVTHANAVKSADINSDLLLLNSFVAAYGGPINMRYSGFMSPFGNRFNAGGPLQSYGADWTNGVISVNEGGTHELNPYGGVPMGTDLNGTPNVVEEGEEIWNDYVFSNRIKIPKAVRKKYKLRGTKDLTFADAVKLIKKESEERPNDPISKRGLNTALIQFAMMLEYIRNQELMKGSNNLLAKNEFSGGGKKDSPDIKPSKLVSYGRVSMEDNSIEKELQNSGLVIDENGVVDWDKTYAPDSEFSKRRNFYLNNWDEDWFKPYRDKYLGRLKENNPNVNFDNFNKDDFSKITSDRKNGWGHVLPSIKLSILSNFNMQDAFASDNDLLMPGETPLFSQNEIISDLKSSREKTETPLEELKEDIKENDDLKALPTWMRYAPVAGAAAGALYNIFKKPDYSNADEVLKAANDLNSYSPVKAHVIGDYLTYNPFDINYYSNKLGALAAATRNAIINLSGGNRASAVAGLLAADYNAQGKLGDLFRLAEEYNLAQKMKVGEFNRGTNMYNADALSKADMANLDASFKAKSGRLSGVTQAMAMKNAIDLARSAAISSNLSNLFNSIGNIGKENFVLNQVNSNDASLYGINRDGTDYYKSTPVKRSKGGYLTIKNRKKHG